MERKSGVSKARVLKGEYVWTIEGFSLRDSTVGKFIDSEDFVLAGNFWKLQLNPGGDLEETRATCRCLCAT